MRAWVLGNGESLKRSPLHLLKNEITFGCNRIHRLPFSPTYYVRFEPPDWMGTTREFFDECRLHINNGEHCIFPHWKQELGEHPNVEFLNSCHHYKYPHTHKKFPHEWHLPLICDTNAVTTMMQIAVLKGASEIVLLGCDLVGAHFSQDDKGKVETERLLQVHETAARCCPVPVYNATLGGLLECYPRRSAESFF